ncbi:hypothetical protein RIF29_23956 [Crotalaria pallida]|uniref:Exocyst complex component Sec10-like alpha-helical bundle domain-containing protein n=1 Tax=Crotalaria pallida TaxID=3830 RepID=A0AAN9HY10_CROPI
MLTKFICIIHSLSCVFFQWISEYTLILFFFFGLHGSKVGVPMQSSNTHLRLSSLQEIRNIVISHQVAQKDKFSNGSGYVVFYVRVVAYLSRVLESAFTALEGLNKQAFLTELGNRLHKVLLNHWQKFTFNPSGGLRLKRDITEYGEFVRSFNAPSVDEKFELLGIMANVFIVAPESLATLFEGTPSIRKDAQNKVVVPMQSSNTHLRLSSLQEIRNIVISHQVAQKDKFSNGSGYVVFYVRVVAYLSRVLESAFTALEGLNKQAFLTELGNRLHKVLLNHWQKFTFNPSGGLRLKRDITEYGEFVRSFNAPSVDEKFELLGIMANVFIVAPESLATLFEGTPSIRKDAQNKVVVPMQSSNTHLRLSSLHCQMDILREKY